MEGSGAQAGWYPDQNQPGQERYWDGSQWTDQVRPTQQQPMPPPPGGQRQYAPQPKRRHTFLKVMAGVVVGGLLLIGGCVALFAGGVEEASKQAEESRTTGGETVGVGQPLLVEGTQYRVISATTADSVGSEFARETAPAGTTYVIVDLELVNKKTDTRTVATEAIKLITPNGNEYDTDTDASVAAAGEGSTLLLEEIQPDVPKRGKVIFAVPQAQVSGARLRVEDLFSDAHGFIRLGL
jgi:hypothetical protein